MKKVIFAVFAIALAVSSCTPEDLANDEQLIDKDKVETPGGNNGGSN
jgi:hypothetical protein